MRDVRPEPRSPLMNATRAISFGATWGVTGAIVLQVVSGVSDVGLLTFSIPFLVVVGVSLSLVAHFLAEILSPHHLPTHRQSVLLNLVSPNSLSIAAVVALLLPIVLAPAIQQARETA